jgi:hypothetical protein
MEMAECAQTDHLVHLHDIFPEASNQIGAARMHGGALRV